MRLEVTKEVKKTKENRVIKGQIKPYSIFGDDFFDISCPPDILSFFDTGNIPSSFDFSYSRKDAWNTEKIVCISGRFERKKENGDFMFKQTYFKCFIKLSH